MINKNIISTTIRTLERVIGILENCKDTNEMSEATRSRVIEMLNTTLKDSAFITQSLSKQDIVETERKTISENEMLEQPLVEFDLSPIEAVDEAKVKEEQERLEQEKREVEEAELKRKAEEARKKEIQEQLEQEKREAEAIAKAETDAEAERIAAIERAEKEKIEKEIEEQNNKLQLQQNEILKLQEQLEREKIRLEELNSWNSEKQKKEEQVLLKVLEQEKQKKEEQKTEVPQIEHWSAPVEEPLKTINETDLTKNIVEEPKKEEVKEEKKESLINKFLGKKVINETFEYEDVSAQGLTPITHLTKAIGINDKFQFIKELFGGDSDLYNETIDALNNIGSFQSGINYVKSTFEWDDENPTVKNFIILLKRRYL